MRNILPDSGKLYKYRSFERIDFIEEIIKSNKIWAASPLDFNDSFDCMPFVNIRNSTRQVKEYISNEIKSHKFLLRKERRFILKKHVKEIKSKKDMFISIWKKVICNYGIVSFEESFDNLLMWSHYADSHKGICIEFSLKENFVSQLIKEKIVSGNVKYDNNQPEMKHSFDYAFNICRSREELFNLVRDIIFTKYEGWAYEKEWRWLKEIDNEQRHINLPQGCISKIIMGAKSSREDKLRIKSIIENNKLSIPVVNAVLDERRYAIKVK